MRARFPLSCVLTMLVALCVLRAVSAQTCTPGALVCNPSSGEYVQITSVNVPTSVGAGQPVTFSITVSYDLLETEELAIAIMPHTEAGSPYPLISASSNCNAPTDTTVCFAQIGQSFTPNVITVSFTLVAPSTPQTWRPSVFAMSVIPSLTTVGYTPQQTTYQVVTVNVT